jgi:hypothetical protein
MSTVRIQVRRGSATDWSGVNPILAAGELGVETNTRKIKVGDGSTAWNSLSYVAADAPEIGEISQDAINTALTMGAGLTKTYNDGANTITISVDSAVVATVAYVDAAVTGLTNSTASTYLENSDRGSANGVASLDGNIKVPEAQLKLTGLATDISTSGSISGENLTLAGNLFVNGTTVTLDTANFTTEDPLIALASTNAGNALDLGFVAKHNDGVANHTGFARDASANKWKLFTGVTDAPTTTINFSQGGLDDLELRNLTATDIGLTNLTVTGSVTLPAGSVETADLATDAISTVKILNGAVTADKIAVDAITAEKIADLQITNDHVSATAAIHQDKISGLGASLAAKSDLASPTFTGTVTLPSTTSIGTVSSTEIGYLDGVTSSVQTQITAAATALSAHEADTTNVHGIADTALLALKSEVAAVTPATLGLGNVDNTSDANKPVSTAQSSAIATAKSEAIADATSQVSALISGAPAAMNTLDELAQALGDDANFAASVTTSLGLKVDSLTPIVAKTASYTLSSLTERDDLIEMGSGSPLTLTIPEDATLDFPIGTSIDILQTGAGQVTIAPVSGTVTVNATPGLKLRTTWSSCTLFKRAANTWVVYGDLMA